MSYLTIYVSSLFPAPVLMLIVMSGTWYSSGSVVLKMTWTSADMVESPCIYSVLILYYLIINRSIISTSLKLSVLHHPNPLLAFLLLDNALIDHLLLLLDQLVGPRVVPPEGLLVPLADPLVVQLHMILELSLGRHTQQQGFLRIVVLVLLSVSWFTCKVTVGFLS